MRGTREGDVVDLLTLCLTGDPPSAYPGAMPRGPRLDAPGVLHHVMARGIEGRALFRDDRDRAEFVRRLADLAEVEAFQVYARAFLPNQVHLLVRTGRRPLAHAMRRLLAFRSKVNTQIGRT